MDIFKYDYLPEEAKEIRIKVFVEEQGFTDEMDEIDDIATHFVAFSGKKPVGTCRIFETKDGYVLGRLAVLKEFRKNGVGKELLKFAQETVAEKGGSFLKLHSQTHAINFYEKCGYKSFGEIEYEQDCPHIWMIKNF